MPNFTVVTLKMSAYSPKNRENGNWYKFASKGKFWSPRKKLNIDAPSCMVGIVGRALTVDEKCDRIFLHFGDRQTDQQTNRWTASMY